MNSFPKIFQLGQRYITTIFDSDVEITEKIDGSQFGFGKIDNEVICRSKGRIIPPEDADKLFKPAVDYILSIKDKLPEGKMFYGETLCKKKHNIKEYGRVPKNNIILFGVCDSSQDFSYDIDFWGKEFDLETVPVFFNGKVNNFDDFTNLLEKESILGGTKIEGVVVKNYSKELMVGDRIIPLMCGKYVSEQFKEQHANDWKKSFNGKCKWEMYLEKYRTEARWDKSVQWLKENKQYDGSPKDIGKLIVRVKQDIIEENKEDIKEKLWSEFSDQLLKRSVAGLPEWYKEKLLKDSF